MQEAKDVPKCYYFHNDTLFRKWRPPSRPADEDRATTEQVVLPKCCRQEVLQLVHESLFGHMAAKKTLEKLSQHLYWPSMWKDMKLFWCRCHVCQVVEEPSVSNPVTPLQLFPVEDEPFAHIMVDFVGPCWSQGSNQ